MPKTPSVHTRRRVCLIALMRDMMTGRELQRTIGELAIMSDAEVYAELNSWRDVEAHSDAKVARTLRSHGF